MIPVPKPSKPPKINRLSFRAWTGGYNSQLDVGRTPSNSLVSALNVRLYQDGTVGPRPSLVPYGETLLGTVLGEVYEFLNTATLEKWLITLQNVAGLTKVTICKDGGAWQVVDGKDYNDTAPAHFVQIDDKVLVMNGEDNLSYLNIPTTTVIPFNALPAATAPTLTPTGLTGTTYTYYYTITANSTVGETAAAPTASQQVGIVRSAWSATSYITVNWTAVTGAQSYNIYFGETADAQYLIASAVTGVTFKDDGSAAKDITHTAPVADTTAGPKVKRGKVINGQVFLTGDKDFPRYVRYGGKGSAALDFSPYGGGGWNEIGKGTKEFPVVVVPFRTGQGNPGPLILTKGTNGYGKRYTMQDATVNVGDEVITYFDVKEDNGQDGTDSPDAVVTIQDQLIYPSRDGIKSTFTKAQIQNILSTESLTEAIENDVSILNVQAMEKAVGISKDGIVYFALPVGSQKNNQIWLLDLGNKDRRGAWMLPYNISADWMTLYEDNTGETHHLVLSDNRLFQLSTIQATQDGTLPFQTAITSGQLRFSEDGEEWATVTRVTFILLRARGTIEFSIFGRTEDSDTATVGTEMRSFRSNNPYAGWGEKAWGLAGWGQTFAIPSPYGNPRTKVQIEIDEDMNYVAWSVGSSEARTSYQLSDVIIENVNIGILDSDG